MLATRRAQVVASAWRAAASVTRSAHCLIDSRVRSWQRAHTPSPQATALPVWYPLTAQQRSYVVPIQSVPKMPQCPTCGAAFQTENPRAAGYLNQKKWRQMNQANVVKGLPSIEGAGSGGSVGISVLADQAVHKTVANDKRLLSDDEFTSIVSDIEDPEIQELLTGKVAPESADPNAEPEDPQGDKMDAPKCNQRDTRAESFATLIAARVRRRAEQGRDRIICQRCHSLKNYSRVDRPWKEDIVSDPRVLRFLRYKSNIMIVVVCDLFDIPGSLIPHLGDIIGSRHPVVLVANKSDLLPRDYHKQRLLMWLKRFVGGLEVNVRAIHFVAALKNLGIRELAADIMEQRRPGQDIYMVGRANVGKSELINALLRISMGGSAHTVLASHVPGTTMGLYGIPLRRFAKALVPLSGAEPQDRQVHLYDTPGVFSNKSIISYLTNEELKLVVCQKRVSPFTFILNLGQSVMLGGLGRVDLVDGPSRILVTVFSTIRPHFTRIQRADELVQAMQSGKQTILQPPVGDSERLKWFPHQKLALEHKFAGQHKRNATLDVVFGGVGWIAVTGQFPQATIRVYSPFGAGVCVRPPMMPFEYERITSHMSSQRKTPK